VLRSTGNGCGSEKDSEVKVKGKSKAFTAEDGEGKAKSNDGDRESVPRFSKTRFDGRDVPTKVYIPKVTLDVLACIDLGGFDPIIPSIHR
jgi:hypothetical protein